MEITTSHDNGAGLYHGEIPHQSCGEQPTPAQNAELLVLRSALKRVKAERDFLQSAMTELLNPSATPAGSLSKHFS